MNILIIGASQGIGYHTALKFAQENNRVLAVARNSVKLNELLATALESNFEGEIQTLSVDINNTEEIVSHTRQLFDKIDVLINCAGKLINKPYPEIQRSELEEVYNTNIIAPFILIRDLLPLLRHDAHIINIGSVGGVTGTVKFPGLSAYSSSKSALSCLTECLQEEFSNTDWTFNCLALGAVQTEMLETAFPGYKAPVSANKMGEYIYHFALNSKGVIKGKTILISQSNP